jgi:Terpene synthase family 2, C-terminal metal binding
MFVSNGSQLSAIAELVQCGTTFYIPKISCTPPAVIHPDHAVLEVKDQEWVRTHVPFPSRREMLRFLANRCDRWSCWVYPMCDSGTAEDLVHLQSLMFAIDDRAVSEHEVFAHFADALRGGRVAESRYGKAFHDLWERLRAAMLPQVFERFHVACMELIDGFLTESGSRIVGEVLEPEAYLQMHRHTIGCKECLIVSEHAAGVDVTTELTADSQLGGLWQIAADHVMLVNDVLSFRKEVFAGEPVNIVMSLMIHERLSLQDSVDRVCEMIAAVDCDFTRACVDIRSRYQEHPKRDDVSRYLDALGSMMSGNLAWSYEAPRYHGPGYVWDGQQSGVIELHPEYTIMHPCESPFQAAR